MTANVGPISWNDCLFSVHVHGGFLTFYKQQDLDKPTQDLDESHELQFQPSRALTPLGKHLVWLILSFQQPLRFSCYISMLSVSWPALLLLLLTPVVPKFIQQPSCFHDLRAVLGRWKSMGFHLSPQGVFRHLWEPDKETACLKCDSNKSDAHLMLLSLHKCWENKAMCLIKETLQVHPGTRTWKRIPWLWHLAGRSGQFTSPQCRSGYFVCIDYNVFSFTHPFFTCYFSGTYSTV